MKDVRKLSRDRLPTVTVIMPVRNEAAFIENSLQALLMQDYPADCLELIVVDGRSTDATREIVGQTVTEYHQRQLALVPQKAQAARSSTIFYSSAPPPAVRVRLLDNPGCSAPAGLNLGIQQATGEIVMRVDGHARVRRDYVRRCVEGLITTRVDCVGGAVRSTGLGYVGKAIAIAMSSPFGVGGSRFRTTSGSEKPIVTDTVPFPACWRHVFTRVGLYNEQMIRHQDYEFNYRLRRSGGQILLLPAIRVRYFVRSSLRNLWRQYWQYGLWKGRLLRAHPRSIQLRHTIPPLFVLALGVSMLLPFLSSSAVWLAGVTPGLYLLFLLVALMVLAYRRGIKYVPLLPVILLGLHLSWGVGVWVGLLSARIAHPNSGSVGLAEAPTASKS